jgi:hypothetical protein
MVSFQTKNPNLGKFWRANFAYVYIFCKDWKLLIYFMTIRNILRTYFMTIWYILFSFWCIFPVLVSYTKKNLATLR